MRNFVNCLVFLFALTCLSAQSQTQKGKIEKGAMFKWVDNGVVHYGYVVPSGIKDYEVITSKGKQTEVPEDGDFNDDLVKKTDKNDSKEDAKSKNCEIAKSNKAILGTGAPVFEKNEKGDIIEVKDDAKKTRLEQADKDISYFCN